MGRSYGDRKDRRDPIAVLKKKIKSLEKENALLRKELNKALQFVAEAKNRLEKEEVDYDEESPAKKSRESCENCGKGKYDVFDFKIGNLHRFILTCEHCKHRLMRITKDE